MTGSETGVGAEPHPTVGQTKDVTGKTTVVGDFGGTNARFAVVGATARDLNRIEVLKCADYPRAQDALRAYLESQGIDELGEVCIAVAGPVDQDLVDLPNNHWTFSKRQFRSELRAPLTVLNDFTAQALCIRVLLPDELRWLGDPRPPAEGGIRTVIGPGTGLGVAIETLSGEIVPSEGGHVGFAPTSEHEIDLLRRLTDRYRRVSIERLASGPGIENIYWANRQISGLEVDSGTTPQRTAPEIAALADEGDALARRSLEDFFDILASFAGDMALASWATGGVYLSGGVLRKLDHWLDVPRFRDRFQDKGRFTRFCETVPVAVIETDYPGLLGCSAAVRGARLEART